MVTDTAVMPDPSQPGHIEEFNRNKLPCVGADNDIRRGIDLHYELIKTRKYKEFKGSCPHSQDERETYHYPDPKDLRPDEDSKELVPVGQNDHTCDVDRYLTISTYRTGNRLQPKAPSDDLKQKNRLEYLKRRNRHNGAEEWGS